MPAKLNTPSDGLLIRTRRLLSDHRTRAKRDGAVLDYGLAEVGQLLAEHPLCEYCRAPLSFTVSLDRRTPIGRGGRHQRANLAVCCQRCNRLKGMLTEDEFREVLTLLARLHPMARLDLERRNGGRRRRVRSERPGKIGGKRRRREVHRASARFESANPRSNSRV
jgi:5-methylcytosine-specific restriction endonuclease McrA